MPDTLIDGNYTSPVATGAPRYVYPFRQNGDTVTAYFEQDYWVKVTDYDATQPETYQANTTYCPPALGTPHPVLRDFYFIKETPPVRVMANVAQFTRTFSRIPVTQNVYSTLSFTKPDLAAFATVLSTANNVTGSGTYETLALCYVYNSHFWDGTNNRVYGPIATTTSADSGGDTDLTWTAHGITTQRFVVNVAGTYYVFSSGQYTVFDANTITLTGFNFGTAATQAGKYLRDYTSGIDRISCKVVSTFYLPGVTTGITTGADISIPNPLLNDAAFLAAVVANLSGFLNYDSDQLIQWMDSPIYQLDCVQLNMADL